VDPDELDAALRDNTVLVSVIWANNETGVVQPMKEIARRVGSREILLHSDITQALGKLPMDFESVPVDFLTCSAHKLNGPKGAGCLVNRAGAVVPGFVLGGGQERGWRGGTENVPGIVGFGMACELAAHELEDRVERDAELRDRLWQGLQSKIPGLRRNGSAEHVLPNTLNVEFAGASGEALLQALDLDGVAVSAGAACHSGAVSPSRVLTAMGCSAQQAASSLRMSVGHGVNEEQIDRVVGLLAELNARGGRRL
jgi:cysteine desulfurase